MEIVPLRSDHYISLTFVNSFPHFGSFAPMMMMIYTKSQPIILRANNEEIVYDL